MGNDQKSVTSRADEAERLLSLRSFEILDTLPETDLDDLTLLASHICETPIALLNLVDEYRQWTMSNVGITLGALPREEAFCSSTILERDHLLVVPDAQADVRFRDNPLVSGEEGIRFYAGAALVSSEGHSIGALCVLDRQPRQLRPDQVEALRALARQVVARFEQRRAVAGAAWRVARDLGLADGAAELDLASSFSDAFEHSSAGIALTTLDGVLVRVNDALARMLGRSRTNLIGTSYREVLHPGDLPDADHTFERLVTGGATSLVLSARVVPSDGLPRAVALTSSSVRDANGAARLILTLVEDVATQLALADELTQRWSGADAVVTTDEEGRIRTWSSAAERLFGWSREEMINSPVSVLLPEVAHPQYERRLRRFTDTGAAPLPDREFRLQVATKSGAARPALVNVAPTRPPAAAGFTAVIRGLEEHLSTDRELEETKRAMVELLGNVPGMAYRCRNEPGWPMEVVSAGSIELVGWTPQDFLLGHVTWEEQIHPADQNRVWDEVQSALSAGTQFRIEYRIRHRDGSTRSVIEQGRGVSASDGPGSIEGFIFDITAQARTEEALEREARFRRVVEAVAKAANDAPSVEDALVTVIEEVTALTGWPVGHVFVVEAETNTLASSYWHVADRQRFAEFSAFTDGQVFGGGTGLPGRVLISGRAEWVHDLAEPQNAPRSEVAAGTGLHAGFAFPILVGDDVVAVCEFFSDEVVSPDDQLLDVVAQVGTIVGRVFERTRAREHLSRLALHDALTGLPNRNLLSDRLQHVLDADAPDTQPPAVAFIDLDRFKVVNDSLGHTAGDELLVAVAARLRSIVPPGNTVARLGGDEFVVVLDRGEALDPVLARITGAFAEPFQVGGSPIFCSASIGTVDAQPGATAESMLRDADAAMYAAKAAGGNRSERFDQQMRVDAVRRLEMEQALRQALELDQMELVYQPTVSLPEADITGVEALVRWRHPAWGVVSPLDFIPIAEDTGLIVALGRWILHTACAQAAAWRAAGTPLRVAVNVSVRQLEDDGFLEEVRAALLDHQLDPAGLVLELTESALAQDPEGILQRLQSLAALGVTLAADDFGTGYSSLSYLQRFPLDVLKIDKSFVDGIATEPEAHALVSGIVQMARALDLKVVAEGVETADQAALLGRMGCDFGQGYHFARPMPANEVTALLLVPTVVATPPRLSEVLSTAAASDDLESVTRPLLEALSLLTGLESTFVAAFDWEDERHRILFSRNADQDLDLPEGLVTPLRETPCYRAVTGTGPLASTAAGTDFAGVEVVATLGMQSYLAVPIPMPDGRTFGVLAGASRRAVALTDDARAIAEVLARLIAGQLVHEQALSAERERADRAEERLRHRAQFLAEAEHKLKTPLTIVRGWAETLQDWDQLPPAVVRQGTAALLDHSLRLTGQVDGLLQQARAEIITSDLEIEPIAVDRFLRTQSLTFSALSGRHPVVVTSTTQGTVLADADALHQVIGHLVDNAVKFAPEGCQIELSAGRRRERIELRVDDAGQGLPQGVDVFRAFERSAAAGRAAEGVGLGLHIVRTLVEAMGGTITAGGNERGGARFVISLPSPT